MHGKVNISSILKYSAFCAGGVAAVSFFFFSVASNAQAAPYVVTETGSGQPAVVKIDTSTNVAETVISQKNKAFEPAAVTIRAHRRITIKNDDDVVHHAYCSAEGFKYNSGPLPVGSSVNIMFSEPGTYEVRCAIHPKMLLIVTVTPLSEK